MYGPDVTRTSEEYNDVFLPNIFEESLHKINHNLSNEAIDQVIIKLNSIDGGSLGQRNEVFTEYLQNGVEVTYFDGKEEQNDIIYLIDYNKPENNTYHCVNQWTYVEYSEKRPDIVLFVNGMPLVVFELKSPSREETDASDAYLQLRQYMKQIPSFFVPNAFCVMSDGSTSKVGTITANEDRFVAWKSTDGNYFQQEKDNWRVMLDGMFRKERLIDIIKNFICFSNTSEKIIKILAGYHQYFAVHKTIERTKEAIAGDGRIGVFWHTQGSGKSLSMVFAAHLLQEHLNSPTLVVITDRNDLDDQLYGQFCKCSKFLRQNPEQADSREDLKNLLVNREANGIIFTTMQKFEENDEPLCDRSNVVVMVDEAHRGQYGLTTKIDKEGKIHIGAAKLVRRALPNASYVGFTGTPIATEDKNTREIFGDYIDVYDMTQAVEDEATRPVYYESRVVALRLDQEKIKQIDALYNEYASQSDEWSIEKSKKKVGGLDAILSASETIDSLCRDIIKHYEENRQNYLTGKALIVAYSRKCAMNIYYRMMELKPEWKEKLGVVMTMGNQDPEEWTDVCGGKKHKKEMEKKFKAHDDPLKIAIVVDMWLTGFDVPDLATMYMYKPMSGHNLMQAIARVNRVYLEKEGGLVVDYIGIASALKQAMKDYTNRDKANYGDMDIANTAYPKFLEQLSVCKDYLHGFDYVEKIFSDSNVARVDALSDGADYLLDPKKEEDREEFLKQCQIMNQALSLCKSMVNDHDQIEAAYFTALRVQILRILGCTGKGGKGMTLKQLNERVAALLEQSVKTDGVINLIEKSDEAISLFNEDFIRQLANMKEKNIAYETLKRLIDGQIKAYTKRSLVKAQKFSEMLQSSVNGYLNGMLTNAEVIEELLNMAHEMMKDRDEEQKLGLSSEEMAFYDALTKPQAVKDFYSNEELVSITQELTETLRKSSTIDWQKKESARAGMRRAIKHLLRKYKYPPEEAENAMDTVMAQCELWADNQEYSEVKIG